MNSQVVSSICKEFGYQTARLTSSSLMNDTYCLDGKSYLHISSQPHLHSPEETLVLDRYIYAQKGRKIYEQSMKAASIRDSSNNNQVEVPSVLGYGALSDLNDGVERAYWIDSSIKGVNAKEDSKSMELGKYGNVIDWINNAQDQVIEGGLFVGEAYANYIEAARVLYESGYFDTALSGVDFAHTQTMYDVMLRLKDKVVLDNMPVFKHGDLHIANIINTCNGGIGIVDFEASVSGPGDNLKDIMKLLHLDYIFFGVAQTKESSFLSNSNRMSLLDYYIKNSSLRHTEKLRDTEYLEARVALDSLYRNITRLALVVKLGRQFDRVRVQKIVNDIGAVMRAMGE